MEFKAAIARPKDAEVMGRLHSASWVKAYENVVMQSVLDEFTPENRTEVFNKVLVERPEAHYLFYCDEQPAGFAILHKSHEAEATLEEGEIYAIYFHPDYWGHPITHLSFDYCVRSLLERGFSQINIWVLEENARARRFYEKNGFLLDGNEKTIDLGKPMTEVRYSKIFESKNQNE